MTVTLLAASPAAARPLEVDDLFRIEHVASPAIRPDGRWIAYTTSRPDLQSNGYDVALWMVASTGGQPIRVSEPGTAAGAPAWSPDGTALTYLAPGADRRPQVWAYYPETRSRRRLSDVPQGVSSFLWSPVGDRLALVLRDAPVEDEGWDGIRPPWVIDRLQLKADGVGYLDRRRSHIYVLDLETGDLAQITSGDFDDSSPTWSPDGTRIAFSSNRTNHPDRDLNSEIWVVQVDRPERPLARISSSPGEDWSPVWSPDGRHIAYLTHLEPGVFYYSLRKLVVHDLATGENRMITRDVDLSEHDPAFSPDGSEILFRTDARGRVELAKVDVSTGAYRVVDSGEQWVFAFSVAGDGTIAAVIGAIDAPGGYWTGGNLFLLEAGAKRQITFHNRELRSELDLAIVERVDLPGSDGRTIEAWLFKPADFSPDTAYPLLIRIHGGPIAQWGYKFNFMAQLLAANGYLVLLPNPCGSSGYGHEFQLEVLEPYGPPAARDVIAAAVELAKRPDVDNDGMGILGWSFGGITVDNIITTTDLFKAAIAGAGSCSLVGRFGTNQYSTLLEHLIGLPWENRAAWEEASSFNRVQHAVTPTLFVSGEEDWNVPVASSEQMYTAMKRLGRDVKLVVYPGEPHEITVPRYLKHMHELFLEWFDQHLKTD